MIEILSPSTAITDQRRKREVYAERGGLEYWIVSPETKTIEVLSLRAGIYETLVFARAGDFVYSSVLVGLELSTEKIFD